MKIRKVVTTFRYGVVGDDDRVVYAELDSFDGAKSAKREFKALQQEGKKVFIDECKKKSVQIEIPDDLLLELYQQQKSNEDEEK